MGCTGFLGDGENGLSPAKLRAEVVELGVEVEEDGGAAAEGLAQDRDVVIGTGPDACTARDERFGVRRLDVAREAVDGKALAEKMGGESTALSAGCAADESGLGRGRGHCMKCLRKMYSWFQTV